jgi:metallo-beta-lactamase class B
MSEPDWRELEKPVLQIDNVLWGRPPKRDMAVADGQKLQLGDTTVDLYLTSGHTPGTLSAVFAAKDGSRVHRALLWGGTAFNFGKNAPRMRSYIASTRRMAGVVAQERIDVILSNHASYDGSFERMAKLATRQQDEPHPFVVGEATVERAINVMGECARAFLASFDSEP